MEGRLGRFLQRLDKSSVEKIAASTSTPIEMTSEEVVKITPKERVRWGERVRTSEINDETQIDELLATPNVHGQTTLPWDGVVDMEIYSSRTMNDSIKATFNKLREQQARFEQFVENNKLATSAAGQE